MLAKNYLQHVTPRKTTNYCVWIKQRSHKGSLLSFAVNVGPHFVCSHEGYTHTRQRCHSGVQCYTLGTAANAHAFMGHDVILPSRTAYLANSFVPLCFFLAKLVFQIKVNTIKQNPQLH